MKDHLAPYKYPRQIQFVDDLPKTATGKIQRFKLRDQEKQQGRLSMTACLSINRLSAHAGVRRAGESAR